MRQSHLAFKPVRKYSHSYAATNVTTAAWVEVVAATDEPCNAIEIFDSSGSILEIALGAAASEVAIPYNIPPGGSVIFLPIEIAKGSRISLRALDANATTGYFIANLFG
jgi:hypothetical protein